MLLNIFVVICAVIIIIYMIRKMTLKKSIISILTGISSLLACDLLMSFFGNNMPINQYTILISSFGGIPGVILLTLLKCFY